MSESYQRKIGAFLSYGSIFVNTIITALYTPFMLRMIGQSEYGLYSLVASVIGYLTVLDLGFGNAIIVYTSKFRSQGRIRDEKMLHGMFMLIFCLIGIIASILGAILYCNIESLFGDTMSMIEISKAKVMMIILIFNLVITFPFSIYASIISAYENFVFQKIVSIVRSILNPLLMIPLLLLGYKAIMMTMIITVLNIGTLILNYYYCKNKLNVKIKFYGFDIKLFKEIFKYSFYIFLVVIVDKINWSADQFILGAVSGTIAVSVYSIASQLNMLFVSLSTAISGVLLPKMSKMVVNNATREQITAEFIKVGRLQYLIIFLMVSGLILFGKEFIIWWAGEEYTESYYVALILIIPVSIPLIQNLGLSVMQAMNKYKFKAISTFGMAIFNIIISIFLAKKFGAIGSAVGTAIGLIICNIILINIYYQSQLKLNILRFWKEILHMTVPFFIPIIVILILMYYFPLKGMMEVFVFGTIYTSIYIIIAYMFSMNKYEKNVILRVYKKLTKFN